MYANIFGAFVLLPLCIVLYSIKDEAYTLYKSVDDMFIFIVYLCFLRQCDFVIFPYVKFVDWPYVSQIWYLFKLF